MITTMDISLWIDKAVRGLREEDQKTYRQHFQDQLRQSYEGFLASGQGETEARSLAFALLGNAREVRARLKNTLITQAEQDLLDRINKLDDGTEPIKMSRVDSHVVLSICFLLSIPVWFIVPLNMLLKAALLLLCMMCLFVASIAFTMMYNAWIRWMREHYTLPELLLWRAFTLPTIFVVSSFYVHWSLAKKLSRLESVSLAVPSKQTQVTL